MNQTSISIFLFTGFTWISSWYSKFDIFQINLLSPELNSFGAFPGGSDGKESASSAGDLGSVPGLGRSSGEGNGNPLQYSCLQNSMDRGAWQGTVHGVAKVSEMKRLALTHSI